MQEIIVTPSSQVDSTLPQYIYENYSEFVEFMTSAAESEERVGFGQDILQNLQKYRNFDTYRNEIVQFQPLSGTISADDTELTIEDGYGFPENNGVLLIDDEIILYRTKEGNTFYELERGAPGTKVLPTFRSTGEYVETVAAAHNSGSRVTNLSVLFLVAMLDTIQKSFTPNVEAIRISPEVNRSNLLQNIKDFFASKGSKLGIQALFKMFFAQNDVDVSYPGDQMIVPSDSTWYKSVILRSVPVPRTFCDPLVGYGRPDKVIGTEITYKSFLDDRVYARVMCDYVSSYPYNSEMQYEMSIDVDNMNGEIFTNPRTELTRTLRQVGGTDDRQDVYTVTVASTIGFPDSGVIYIDNEAIAYTSKTSNQFLGCTRGYIGVETTHATGTFVYGPYYIESTYEENGETFVSRSFPLGLVGTVEVNDPGTLHTINDEVFVSGSGREDQREVAFHTFLENTTDELAGQMVADPQIGYIGNYTAGVSGVFMGPDNIAVTSSGLPYYDIGPFSTDDSVGPDLVGPTGTINGRVDEVGDSEVYIIPRSHNIKPNTTQTLKGSGIIGVCVDGAPFYSNESEEKVYSGAITQFAFENNGANYVNPTVLINGSSDPAFSPIVTNGRVVGITGEGSGDFNAIPTVEVTSGQGAEFGITFDRFGRITNVVIIDGGQFYNDTPTLQIYDQSDRGRGGVLACTAEGGSITSVTIVGSGIDYNPNATTIIAVPVGSGALVTAGVQSYTIDTVFQINKNPTQTLDSGNGFLFNDGTSFGYAAGPVKALERLNDVPTEHSSIIGWAADGNPIYGPFGYRNGKAANEGIARAYSGWSLREDRSNISSDGGQFVGTNPPSELEYPMGSFIEDYIYTGENTSYSLGRLNTEVSDRIQSESLDYINAQTVPGFILDENNGRVCNTPEYPEELYPDGVYCYFVTLIGTTPYYPYVVGKTFQNLPINLKEALTTFNFTDTNIHRHRIAGLPTTGDDVSVAVDTILPGSISEVVIESGLPNTTVVGDILRYNNTNTKGSGAEAKVTHVDGVVIDSAFGQEIVTRLLSHRQRLNLRFNVGTKYTFSTGYQFRTSSGAEAVVESYDPVNMFLDVSVTSENVIRFGDTFFDQKNRSITIPTSQDGNDQIMFDKVAGAASTYISYAEPGNEGLRNGDLWWSSELGRLFIYYVDQDSSQWVATNPIGIRPLEGVSEYSTGQPGPVTQAFSVPQGQNRVTISTMAPSSHTDGTANQPGDLWWSSHSGILYMWNNDKIADYEQGELEWTGEWIATDPNALNAAEGADHVSSFLSTTPNQQEYETGVTVIVSEGAPTVANDGDNIKPGNLWWSPLTGRMYIYYSDADSNQWVVTNPSGVLSTQYANDTTIIGDGGLYPDYVTLLATTTTTDHLWFESLKYFEVDDTIEFRVGAPGVGELVEQARILERTGENSIRILRGTNGTRLELPHGVQTFCMSRGLYTVDTKEPHGLRNGDEVIISGSRFSGVNGTHTIENAGVIIPAKGTVQVVNGEVTNVTIDDPGNFYQRNFYVTFVGGGGVGAIGYATVADIVDGGGVIEVTIQEGGHNYTSSPTIIFGDETTNTRFTVLTDVGYSDEYLPSDLIRRETITTENNIGITTESIIFIDAESPVIPTRVSYITNTENIKSTAARFKVTSGGVGYESMPAAIGLLKKQSDRAETRISLNGTTIGSVEVVRGGFRYTNPIAVFSDLTGNGSGAEAEVSILDGIVTSIDIVRAGSGYVEPHLELIEGDGMYITKTETIGRLKSLKVLNPGRNLSNDKTLTPELDVETRLVVKDPFGQFTSGQLVYQGSPDLYLASATVSGYDSATQILTVRRISGRIVAGENINNIFGSYATVVQSGQGEVDIVPNGSSQPAGRFIDNSSMTSESFAVIQDSEYYQRFSYVISSPLQQVMYEDFVRDIVHPSGFKMFSDVTITGEVTTTNTVQDITFSPDEDYTIYELMIADESVDPDYIYVWTENSEFIDL